MQSSSLSSSALHLHDTSMVVRSFAPASPSFTAIPYDLFYKLLLPRGRMRKAGLSNWFCLSVSASVSAVIKIGG